MLIRNSREKHNVRDIERERVRVREGEERARGRERERELVSWCFEPIIDKLTSKHEKRKPKTIE